MYGFRLSEDGREDMAARCRQYLNADDRQLMMAEINLNNYSDTDLGENALLQLDSILSEVSSAKKQLILRFLYDWDGRAMETEPAEISQIMRHMDQVSAVVNRHAETVFIVQGVFTGNHGEMNTTRYGSLADCRLLMTHLADTLSPSIFLAVRTPSQLRGITQSRSPVTSETAFDGTLSSRLGLFNDGMLGSASDLGTYGESSFADSASPSGKGTREEELSFQDSLCQYVPNGGETVIDNPFNDLENAIADMRRMHISYLNRDYDSAVFNKWSSSIYEEEGIFQGRNGLDYIEAHLGYRYVLTGAALSYESLKNTPAALSFSIRNTGFAPAYQCFEGTVTLRHTATGILLSIPAQLDTRTIKAGSEAAFTVSLPVRSLPEGSYEVSFGLMDPRTDQPVLFANEGAGADGVLLGTLTAETAEPGSFLRTLIERFTPRKSGS